MKVTILGCGTSGGVPRVGHDWGACDPKEPRNRRRRASILVEEGNTRILVDTSPDLREQCLDSGIESIDAVLYTHAHADHVHGIDDLRFIAYRMKRQIDVYADAMTLGLLQSRFDYVFDTANPLYPAIAKGNEISGLLTVKGMRILPFSQRHGDLDTLGFRFGPIAYSTDVVALDEEAFEALSGVKVWIVDALRYARHPTHANLDQALEWITRIKPQRAILTHMNVELDYMTLKRTLPIGVEPAFDGMVIEV